MSGHYARNKCNRLTVCPLCGGRLGPATKDTVTDNSRFAYRDRPCLDCGYIAHTKQPPEEWTGPFSEQNPHMRKESLK